MKINLIPSTASNPKSTYNITIQTMTGDGDDEHEFNLKTESQDELREIIIGLELLKNKNPDDYSGEFFEKYIKDELCYDSNYDTYDSIGPFNIKYYDDYGNEFIVNYTPDDDMLQKIKQ